MTLKELCEKYHFSESSVRTKFNRTRQAINKKFNIDIIKVNNNDYQEIPLLIDNDHRELTIFAKNRSLNERANLDTNDFKLENFTFKILIALLTTPMLVFRGTVQELLEYMDIKITHKNKEKYYQECLTNIQLLKEKGIIITTQDKDIYIIAISRWFEQNHPLFTSTAMLIKSKQVSIKYKLKDWVPILKVWLSIIIIFHHEMIYTIQDLVLITGLSKASTIKYHKILTEEKLISPQYVYQDNPLTETRQYLGKTAVGNHESFVLIDQK